MSPDEARALMMRQGWIKEWQRCFVRCCKRHIVADTGVATDLFDWGRGRGGGLGADNDGEGETRGQTLS